jgi:hypothetical protein
MEEKLISYNDINVSIWCPLCNSIMDRQISNANFTGNYNNVIKNASDKAIHDNAPLYRHPILKDPVSGNTYLGKPDILTKK